MIKESKNKKYLFSVLFKYFPDTNSQEEKEYTEDFYTTYKQLEDCLDAIERAMLRCGGKLYLTKINKQS